MAKKENAALLNVSNGARRAPPAFQLYAADRLADRNFKLMTLAERGMQLTLECECWINGFVPSDRSDLARVLGLEVAEVQSALTERVMRCFAVSDGVITSPELTAYRKKLDEYHRKKSAGGRKGADARWNCGNANGLPSGLPNGSLSREESKPDVKEGSEHQEFLDGYDGPAPFEAGKKRARQKPEMNG